MNEFLQAVSTHTFLQNAILAGLLASLSCGVVGSYVVVKQMSFISGGIAHAVLAGMGIAYFCGGNPMWGAVPAALIFALIIGWITLRQPAFSDTVIGALWATGMSVGILFIYGTPGYAVNLFSYLFGNIYMVTKFDVTLLLVLDLVIIGLVFTGYKGFMAVCFDEEFARLQGARVKTLYLTLLCLIALTVVILVQIVGIVMVIALLTLPAAIARQWTGGLFSMMVAGTFCALLFTMTGLAISYPFNLPGGATIVLLAGLSFLFSTTIYSIRS
ncbi:MAG: metal ABC transporter permease [Lentisphaeria bacterium]